MALSTEQLILHNRMVSVKEEVEADLLALEPVRGIGVGLRKENNALTDELAIIIYVRGDANTLAGQLPTTIRGFPVAVQEGEFLSPSSVAAEVASGVRIDKERYNPLLGGISIGASRVSTDSGTLGLMVRGNRAHEDAMMLSNYHVMGLKDGKAKEGDEICQQSREDNSIGWCGNCAKLSRWYAGNFTVASKEYGLDAAVAVKTARDAQLGEVISIGKLNGVEQAAVGMAVQKRGRTTELTDGTIQSISTSTKYFLGPPYGEVNMANQIVVVGNGGRPFSGFGDSGSVFISAAAKKVVGLLWGIENGTGDSMGSYITPVLLALDITIATSADVVRGAEEAGLA